MIINARNRRLLVRAAFELDKIVTKGIKPGISDYLTTFDKVDDLNSALYSELGVRSISPQITTAKLLTVDLLSDRLTNYPTLSKELTQPIKQILSRNLLVGATFADAERELRTFLTTTIDPQTGDTFGHLNRYAKQLTRDALNQYDGAVKTQIQRDLKMTHFRYIGSMIKTTRSNCRHMITKGPVTEMGRNKQPQTIQNRFADLRQDDGGYLVADIPTIIERSRGGGGWNPATTPENYFVNRGGFNCRHEAIPYIYNSRRAQRALKTL